MAGEVISAWSWKRAMIVETSNGRGKEQWSRRRAMIFLLVMIVTFNHCFIFNLRP